MVDVSEAFADGGDISPDRSRRPLIEELASWVSHLRHDDPTAPVVVLVDSAAEALELKEALARSPHLQLHIGVSVESVDQAAARLTVLPPGSARLAEAVDLLDLVRRETATGYFEPLHGRAGVAEELTRALDSWDRGDPDVRADLGQDGAPKADRDRADALRTLHDRVMRGLADRGMTTIGTILRGGVDGAAASSAAWIDATVTGGDPSQRHWLADLRLVVAAHRLDPCARTQVPPGGRVATLTSTVDPLSEAEAAARTVTQALERGIAARDIVIAVPDGSRRYAEALGRALTAAGVPCDFAGVPATAADEGGAAGSPTQLRYTPTGRGMTALICAADEAQSPGLLRFDHLRRVCEVAVVQDSAGERISVSRLKGVWRAMRGSDPVSWSEPSVYSTDPAAEALATVASAAQVLGKTRGSPAGWAALAGELSAFLAAMRPIGEADAACRKALQGLIGSWAVRDGSTGWSQARTELLGAVQGVVPDRSGGVRIVPLAAAWALRPRVAVVVGLSDDIVPGTTAPIGPLAPDEILRLAAPGVSDREELARAGLRSLQALARNADVVHLLYPRSDLLRTIERTPSRHLRELGAENVHSRTQGSVLALQDWVDSGSTGLLGDTDAAASLVRCGVDPASGTVTALASARLAEMVDCGVARLRPGPTSTGDGPVDRFNGDFGALVGEASEMLSPDFRKDAAPQLSPSQAERLIGCPIGWWASRRMGMDDPRDWDSHHMDPLQHGSWVHEAFAVLEERPGLLSPDLSQPEAEQALWYAVGGDPSGDLRTAGPNEDTDLWSFRFRLSADDVSRNARMVVDAARRLGTFLNGLGGSLGGSAELDLGPLPLPLGGGSVAIGGRADRVDIIRDGFLITDFKTGARGEGFQLAAYAWLYAVGHPGLATLLYASTNAGDYKATELEEGGPTSFDRRALQAWLIDQLEQPVAAARSGSLPSTASQDHHHRYCPVCSDLVPPRTFGGPRSDRAVALAEWQPAGAPRGVEATPPVGDDVARSADESAADDIRSDRTGANG